MLSKSGCRAEVMPKIMKTINNKALWRIGNNDWDHIFKPTKKARVVIAEAPKTKVREKFNRWLLSFPESGRNRMIAMDNPKSEIRAISPTDDIAAEESPTASGVNNFAAIIKKTKFTNPLIAVPTIMNEAFLITECENNLFFAILE